MPELKAALLFEAMPSAVEQPVANAAPSEIIGSPSRVRTRAMEADRIAYSRSMGIVVRFLIWATRNAHEG